MPESPVDAAKPPYRVPSMAEVAEVRGTNGLTVVSTFSGCGGSCLGFEMAGYEVLWASEFVPAAREVYALNHPGVLLDDRDIRTVRPEDVLEAIGKEAGEVDVLEGSPPCASFSTAGKRHKSWGQEKKYSDTTQRADDLFFEFARLLRGIQPRAFVAENVSGLVKGVAKGYFKEILKALQDCGYRVEARMLDAQWLGVPQARKRIIFMGVRNDLERDPAFPSPLPYRYSIRDALPWLTRVKHDTGGEWSTGDVTDQPCPVGGEVSNAYHFKAEEVVGVGGGGGYGNEKWQTVDEPARTLGASPVTGNGRCPPGEIVVVKRAPESMEGYAVGDEWDKLRPGEQSERYFNLVRAHPERPSPTLTAEGGTTSLASVAHPTEKRKFTIAELRRLCAFPDSFQLTGSYAQQWERLGRAVPPLMMRAVAESLRDGVLLA